MVPPSQGEIYLQFTLTNILTFREVTGNSKLSHNPASWTESDRTDWEAMEPVNSGRSCVSKWQNDHNVHHFWLKMVTQNSLVTCGTSILSILTISTVITTTTTRAGRCKHYWARKIFISSLGSQKWQRQGPRVRHLFNQILGSQRITDQENTYWSKGTGSVCCNCSGVSAALAGVGIARIASVRSLRCTCCCGGEHQIYILYI